MPPTTPTDLGAAVVCLAIATLLAASLASLTGSEGVKEMIGESSMWNPLVRVTMATVGRGGGRTERCQGAGPQQSREGDTFAGSLWTRS